MDYAVPAGNDEFPLWLVDKNLSNFWDALGINRDQFIDLARNEQAWGETFSMPILALRHAEKRNGVSEIHAKVARQMWNFLWPERSVEDVPIIHITNGIHTGSWLARRLHNLYDRYLGNGWIENVDDFSIWEKIDNIPITSYGRYACTSSASWRTTCASGRAPSGSRPPCTRCRW